MMCMKNACGHEWVVMDGGDMHCHPLHDPVVISATRRIGLKTTAELATRAIQGKFEGKIGQLQSLLDRRKLVFLYLMCLCSCSIITPSACFLFVRTHRYWY